MKAWLNLRSNLPERTRVLTEGLKRLGYSIEMGLTVTPEPDDIMLTWNRIGRANEVANQFIAKGLPVLVIENASWGGDFKGSKWLFLNRALHNTAGLIPIGGNERWDNLNVELADWRTTVGETVILAQRGIGSPPVAMPRGWPQDAQRRYGGRIRVHPGNKPHPIPLSVDLATCSTAVTWSSGSALTALMMGIPVFSEAPNWVGQQDNTNTGRLAMFRRLAWNQWRMSEFESGEAFRWMLP